MIIKRPIVPGDNTVECKTTYKSLDIRNGEAICFGNLGSLFTSLGQYDKAREYLEKQFGMTIEIDDGNGEASCYENLGILFQTIGQYDEAREYLEKANVINIEIGDRNGEASC